jgi:2-oxoglutarate ferredoxin oxidoreductase subunit delta
MGRKGEVILREEYCRGCGYCQEFCKRGVIRLSETRLNQQGFFVPDLVNPDECNGCGICVWMCPHFAIEVFRVENDGDEKE